MRETNKKLDNWPAKECLPESSSMPDERMATCGQFKDVNAVLMASDISVEKVPSTINFSIF